MLKENNLSTQSSDVSEDQVGDKIVDELLDMVSGAIPPTVFIEVTWVRHF